MNNQRFSIIVQKGFNFVILVWYFSNVSISYSEHDFIQNFSSQLRVIRMYSVSGWVESDTEPV